MYGWRSQEAGLGLVFPVGGADFGVRRFLGQNSAGVGGCKTST
jgi:hypothetical protein